MLKRTDYDRIIQIAKEGVQRRDDRDKLIESYAAWELIKIATVDKKSSNVRESFRFFQHKPSDIF